MRQTFETHQASALPACKPPRTPSPSAFDRISWEGLSGSDPASTGAKSGLNDFETQAKGEAHIICNGYLYAQLASRGRLRAQWAASAVQHGMSLDLGGELVLTAVGKCGSPAWTFAQRLWPKPPALAPSASSEDRA